MAKVKVKVNIDTDLKDKIAQINNPTTMLALHNSLAKHCNPYVPFLRGPLSQTAQVTSKAVRYIQPYARYQYYGDNFNHTKEFHPLASARWDEAMMRDHGDEFNAEVNDILIDRLRYVIAHGGKVTFNAD